LNKKNQAARFANASNVVRKSLNQQLKRSRVLIMSGIFVAQNVMKNGGHLIEKIQMMCSEFVVPYTYTLISN